MERRGGARALGVSALGGSGATRRELARLPGPRPLIAARKGTIKGRGPAPPRRSIRPPREAVAAGR